MLCESRNTSNSIEHGRVETYIFWVEHVENDRNITCLDRARSFSFVSVEHGRNKPNFDQAGSKHTEFWSIQSKPIGSHWFDRRIRK